MSDQNPYQPPPETDQQPVSAESQPAWIYRRLAAVSSGIGTMVVGVSALSLLVTLSDPESPVPNLIGAFLIGLLGVCLMIAGYHWYGREVNRAIGWWICSLLLFSVGILLG